MAEMDNELAKELFSEGAVLLFLDVPPGTEFGIDYNSWNVGTKFKGVKMIPPGFHVVFYAAVSKSAGQSAPRTSCFHYFKRREIVVKKWDTETEDVVDQDMSVEELERLRSGLMDVDQYLGKYPYESLKKWVSLTNHVTENIMQRVEPTSKKISSVTEVTQQSVVTDQERTSSESMQLDKTEKISFDTAMRFTPVELRKFPSSASPTEITKLCMDKSKVLQDILGNFADVKEILGELQLAFIAFLVGQVYDAFEQWKNLINLLCTCIDAVEKYPTLFESFMGVMHFQLLETPEDFFVDIVSRNNFLVDNLHGFFMTIQDSAVPLKLKRKSRKFKEYLTKRFHWDFDEEPEDDSPVVVEM